MKKLVLVLGALFLLWTGRLYASDEKTTVDEGTKAKVLQEIERYVSADTQLKKYFFIIDPRTDRVLRLTFDHLHDGVAAHPKGFVACADFKDKAGKLFDVDIVVDAASESIQVREIYLHKVDGKPISTGKKEAR